jgi:hypothetical protein
LYSCSGMTFFNCGICLQDLPLNDMARMPCCFTESSTLQYCKFCISAVAALGLGGQLGRCPSCSSTFTIHAGVAVACDSGKCRMCCQARKIVNPVKGLCEKCVLGSSFAFRYECSRCHRGQIINHPMWSYQPSPTEFGTATWACRQCNDYTHWRILSSFVDQIPLEHTPESWGQRAAWLQRVREERFSGAAGARAAAAQPESGVRSDRVTGARASAVKPNHHTACTIS